MAIAERKVARPKAILMVSAHWYTKGTAVTAMAAPKTIHDFYGFPRRVTSGAVPCPWQP